MNRAHHISLVSLAGRLAAVLAGLAGTLLAFSAAAPAALATLPPGGGTGAPSHSVVIRTVVAGGMPGWRVALIALAAAVFAATLAVYIDRAREARQHGTA
jgi:hypothetical protein